MRLPDGTRDGPPSYFIIEIPSSSYPTASRSQQNQPQVYSCTKALDDAKARKKATGSYRPKGDSDARATARENFQTNTQDYFKRKYQLQGLSPEEAEKQAAIQTAQEMAGLDATHALDAIAGGAKGDPLTLANRSINRSIGAQWKSRIKALKKAVKDALERGDKHMDVKLEPCEEEPTS
ncbi:polymorphic toxin type 15 domain-containing protein [Acidiphilium sp.]|uniref:polymorphic toxin type 15 domain-containing protein n=1 Tax=Acidiphilium sp. TaxID=527 RepID=UPI003D092B5C